MSAEIRKEIQLEIAHVLFIDIVGYSKLSINDQQADSLRSFNAQVWARFGRESKTGLGVDSRVCIGF
jgi:hypothetical protein